MLPMAVGPTSFHYGPYDIPYVNVTGAGIGLQRRKLRTYRTLLIAHRRPNEATPHLIYFGLQPGEEGDRFEQSVRARVADRWKGEASFFRMRNLLGFSNKRIFLIVGGLVAVVFIAVIGWAISVNLAKKNAAAPTSAPTTTTTRVK